MFQSLSKHAYALNRQHNRVSYNTMKYKPIYSKSVAVWEGPAPSVDLVFDCDAGIWIKSLSQNGARHQIVSLAKEYFLNMFHIIEKWNHSPNSGDTKI